MGCTVHTTLPAGIGYTTLEIKVNYLRGAQTLTATGTVVHSGRHTATPPPAEGHIQDEHGALIAHATTTSCIILASTR